MRFVALAAVVAAAAVAAGTGSAITGPKVIRVIEVGAGGALLVPANEEPKAGDHYFLKNVLHSWAGTKRGQRIGHDKQLCTFIVVGKSVFCTAQYFLPGGSITAHAFLRFGEQGPQRFHLAVTGGTRAYGSARGWIAARDIGPYRVALTFNLQP